jgi:hypothetical protein
MVDMARVAHEVASDLVREYMRADGEEGLKLTQGIWNNDYLEGYRDAVRSTAVRMGVYPIFEELLNEQTGNTGHG